MDILKETIKYEIEVEQDEKEIRLTGTGEFKEVSAWPVNDLANVVWVRFFPDGKVDVTPGYGGGGSGNGAVGYSFEGFFNALLYYPSVNREVKRLREEVKNLKREIEHKDEKITEQNKKIEKAHDEWSKNFDLNCERLRLFEEMEANIEKLSILSIGMRTTYSP